MNPPKKFLSLIAATSIASICLLATFTGCEALRSAWQRPETQAGLEGLKKATFSFASAAAAESVRQYASTGAVDPAKVATVGGAAALWTAANYIRTLQGTPQALAPMAVANQFASAGIPLDRAGELAQAVTANAQLLEAKGVPRDEAAELTAAAFDAAAKAIQEGRAK